ncbi:hypothetical protein ATKI12_6734 [Kitasatospora sp. Ki12]
MVGWSDEFVTTIRSPCCHGFVCGAPGGEGGGGQLRYPTRRVNPGGGGGRY